jgi:proteasome lid subunit RPN8/RPN11
MADPFRAGAFIDRPAIVRVCQSVLDAVAAHARETVPQECCGLLLGSATVIEHAYRARNVRQSTTRYLVAPEDHFAALRFARSLGIDVVGAYHSHPCGPATPSETDKAGAHDAFLYVIISGIEQQPAQVTAWAFASGNFFRVGLVPVP